MFVWIAERDDFEHGIDHIAASLDDIVAVVKQARVAERVVGNEAETERERELLAFEEAVAADWGSVDLSDDDERL